MITRTAIETRAAATRRVPVRGSTSPELPSQGELSGDVRSPEPARRSAAARQRCRDRSARGHRRCGRCIPGRPVPHADLPTDHPARLRQAGDGRHLIGVTELLDCLWLPGSRWHEQRASRKPLQLQLAAELGFEIPPTLITNSRDDFLDFHRRHNGAIVSKTVTTGCYRSTPARATARYVLTEVVANRDVSHADAVRYCPVTVQPYVDKRVELRVTVVGDRVFPVALDSQWLNHMRHDWRRGDHHHGRYEIHDLPSSHAEMCVELVRRLEASLRRHRSDPHPGRALRLSRDQPQRRLALDGAHHRPADRRRHLRRAHVARAAFAGRGRQPWPPGA